MPSFKVFDDVFLCCTQRNDKLYLKQHQLNILNSLHLVLSHLSTGRKEFEKRPLVRQLPMKRQETPECPSPSWTRSLLATPKSTWNQTESLTNWTARVSIMYKYHAPDYERTIFRDIQCINSTVFILTQFTDIQLRNSQFLVVR